MRNKIKIWLTKSLIDLAFDACPEGKFKVAFMIFIINNIKKIDE